jgi:solute carrier family 25 (mitochondrial carnitine/acylcarnitine transporter), member 20/29
VCRIKVLLQMQPRENPFYTGMVDAAKKTFQAEGFAGLYKGVASPLVGMGIFNAVQFASFTAFRSVWTDGGRVDSIDRITGAAVCTGAAVALIEGPQDLIKSQMQKQIAAVKAAEAAGKPPPPAEYASTLDCAKQVLARRGPMGVMQGFLPTMYRNMVGVGAYFAFYEYARRAFTNNYARAPTTMEVLTAGAAGGFMYWVLCYPLDIVKTLVQTDALEPSKRRYQGMLHAARSLYAKEGLKGFTTGMTPALARSVPANAVGFLLYEVTKDALVPKRS